MATMPLDLTGSLVSNKVTGETKSIARDSDRFFIPVNGAIYDHNGSFKIYNALSGQRLQPNTQYRLLHLVDEAVKISNKNVYAVIHIVDKTLSAVRFDYQAVGGVFQNIASTINDKLGEYLLGTTGSNTIGSVVGVPVQVPPEHHIQNINDFQGAGGLVAVLESIRTSLLLGNGGAFAAAYEHIDYRYQQALANIREQFQQASTKLAILEQKTQIKNGDYIITTNSANPSTYLGYGNWVIDPNVLLYGADSADVVGNYLDVGAGEGYVAIKRYFWRRDDSAIGAGYDIAANTTVVNEGQIVTVTLATTGLDAGTKIAYTISGVTETDLVNQKLNGNFIINSDGVATLPIEIRQDMDTEGAEVMRIALTAMPDKFVDVTINDTSVAATYTLRFSGSSNGAGDISSVNEGSKAYLSINTTGVAAGTRIYLLYNDSTTAVEDTDAADGWPAYFDVASNGVNIVEYAIRDDKLTEGVETLVVNVCTTNSISSRVARAVLTVNDTSRSPSGNVLYSSNSSGTAEVSQVNEGSTVYLFLNTTNVNNGEFIDLAYAGTATQADFSNTLPTRVTINNNQALITLNTVNDVKTEGDETFVVRALYNGQQLAEKALIIKDTSVNPSYSLRFSNNSSGTDTITRANEGAAVYLYVETTNVPDGTVLTLSYSGSSNPAEDFINYPRSLTVVGNRASGVLLIKADQSSEGEENVIVEVKNGAQSIGTAMLYINDTSSSPSAAIRFSTTAGGGNTITQTNEGTTVYAILETTNVNNGTVLNITHSGSATADDFVVARPTTVTINNNVGSVELQVKNDLLSEGLETYRLVAELPNGETVTSSELKIVDSSVPTLNVFFSGNSTGSGQITTINEGQIAYLVIETTGIVPGTTGTTLTYSGTTIASDIDNGNFGLATTPITSGRTIIPYSFAADNRPDNNKTMTITVNVPGITGGKQATITVNDTSKYVRLDADGNIIVPPGKVARIVMVGGGGWANMSSTASVSSASSMSTLSFEGGPALNLRIGESGYAVTATTASGSSDYYGQSLTGTVVYNNGRHGSNDVYTIRATDAVHPNNFKVFDSNLVDQDGICQVLTYVGRSGNDKNLIKTLTTSKLTPALWDIIETLCNPTVAPQVNIGGNVYAPGNGSGSNVLCVLYQNKSNASKTIAANLAKPSHSESSNAKIINGAKPAVFVEFFDTLAEADFGVTKPSVVTNWNDVNNANWPHRVKPGEAWLVTLVSGGGQSHDYFVQHPTTEVGQSVAMYFGDLVNYDARIVVNGGTAAKYLPSTYGTQASTNGSHTISGTLPALANIVGVSTGNVPFTLVDSANTQSPIFNNVHYTNVRQRQFPILPYENNRQIPLAFPKFADAPGYGFPGLGDAGAGGIGAAVTVLLNNTTTADQVVNMVMGPYQAALNTIDVGAGGPGALIINRVYLK